MMNNVLSAPDVFGTLHQLREKTRHNLVRWTAEPNRVRAELTSASISLRREPESEDTYTISLLSSDGETVWSTIIDQNDPVVLSVLRELYDLGTAAAVSAVFRRINEDLASERPSPTGQTTTTPPPARPTTESALRLFDKIKGRWRLNYGRVQEEVEIDDTGNLYLVLTSRGSDVGREIKPRFRLELLECDEELHHVEIAKVELTGRVRQIEVLTVSPQRLEGFSKHEGQSVVYERIG